MKFRQRPVVVDAIQFITAGKTNKQVLREYAEFGVWADFPNFSMPGKVTYRIKLPLCETTLSEGEWIIRDAKGEYGLCKPDAFEATYESLTAPRPYWCKCCIHIRADETTMINGVGISSAHLLDDSCAQCVVCESYKEGSSE